MDAGVLHHLAERRDDAAVELDRHHPSTRRGQRQREGSEPRADLDHSVPGAHPRVPSDRPCDVRIDQEVLTEGPGWDDPVACRQVADPGRADP